MNQTNIRTLEILEDYFQKMQRMLYCKAPLETKRKMLYSANYWAKYFMQIENHLLEKAIKEGCVRK